MERETDESRYPMIDFERIKEIIPEGGSLTLVFKKIGEKIIACYDPKHKVKTGEENFLQPITMQGTASELNDGFEDGIIRIAEKQKTLVEVLNEKASLVDKKIEEAKKKTSKPAATATVSKGSVNKVEHKVAAPSKETAASASELRSNDLFAAVAPETSTTGDDTDEKEVSHESAEVPGSFQLATDHNQD